jgi:putative SOS response-associated peptidase YedK
MCGRIALFTPPAHLARFLDAALAAGLELDAPPSWNVGPQRTLFAAHEYAGVRVMDSYRWGLVPSWAKDPIIGNKLFNARGETIAEKPSFRTAFAKRPCVIPVDGFYEWDHRPGHHREPYFFTRRDEDLLLLAGLYEHWRNPNDGEWIATCTVVTTTPNADLEEIHDRMPVVLGLDEVETWLNVTDYEPAERLVLVRPAPEGTLRYHEVSKAVGSVKNDGPQLAEPAERQTLF